MPYSLIQSSHTLFRQLSINRNYENKVK
uniref:Uncharacterized protein n=1 Tax=Heterorhabditis bacteriophora TaxID=37862 RepID=A0A1I7WLG2_HETBA